MSITSTNASEFCLEIKKATAIGHDSNGVPFVHGEFVDLFNYDTANDRINLADLNITSPHHSFDHVSIVALDMANIEAGAVGDAFASFTAVLNSERTETNMSYNGFLNIGSLMNLIKNYDGEHDLRLTWDPTDTSTLSFSII